VFSSDGDWANEDDGGNSAAGFDRGEVVAGLGSVRRFAADSAADGV